MQVSLFPLGTVLFPGGSLPLRLFEERYMDMAKNCLRDDLPFGVCLIKSGREVGAPAVPHEVGCLAKIVDWEMPQLGILNIKATGVQRFRIDQYDANPKGLLVGTISPIDNDPPESPLEVDEPCIAVLKAIMRGVGEQHFREPFAFEDATWVSNRLAEILPIDTGIKQQLLKLTGSRARLDALHDILREENLLP